MKPWRKVAPTHPDMLEADGMSMSVRTTLQLIHRFLTEALAKRPLRLI
jgi:hypothetical protein